MGSQDRFYLAFNSIHKLRSSIILAILEYFDNDAAAAWLNSEKWSKIAKISAPTLNEILVQKNSIDPDKLYETYLASGCGLTCFGDDDYPQALQDIYDPPLLLFYRGKLPSEDQLCLALIGSRKATPYGHQVAQIFSRDLAYQGAWIVSGMARGIDTICHKGALSAGGKTLAVLGSGIDVIYPRENEELYAHICDNGAVISGFPLGSAALAQNFPRRNRIISGLSQGVIVVEADLNSGTMHTVNHALEQGRDVFAVPGPITSPNSRGTNHLIKDCPSMCMATSADDIWSRYTTQPMKKMHKNEKVEIKNNNLSDQEKKIIRLIMMPQQFDELMARPELAMPASTLAATLTMLEIKGLVKQLPGKYYQTIVKNIS